MSHWHNLSGGNFGLTAGWGALGLELAVMPEQEHRVDHAYTENKRDALGETIEALGKTAFDIHLNGRAYRRSVPANVWNYRLGGYQVLKKWLSYRERKVLGRALRVEEMGYFSEVARRIGAILSRVSEL